MSELDLSIVIPTLNEAANIGPVLRGICQQAERLGLRYEAFIVDGPSTDGTGKEAAAAGARVVEEHAGGFGRAVRRGLTEARGEFVLLMDADGSHSAAVFPEIWAKRLQADLVIGSRLVAGGGMEIPPHRRLLTHILNGFFRLLFGLPARDCSSGYRLYRASAVGNVEGIAQGFDIQQENLIKMVRAGGRVAEVPIYYAWRTEGVSKAKILKFGLGYLRLVARYWRGGRGGA
ncbi:MAG: glycosyltransferase [Elusimicrobiota bacterium]